MSIIHDALKKVQQTNNPEATPPPATPQGSVQNPETVKPQDKTSILLFVAAICAVVAMIFAALPQFTPKKPVRTSAVTVTKQPAPEPAATTEPAPAVPAQTTAVTDPLNSARIEGIMDMGDKKVVLINGNVYEEGQTIHGRTITKITLDAMTVTDNGQERTFSIKP